MRQKEWYRGGVTRRLFIETAGFCVLIKAVEMLPAAVGGNSRGQVDVCPAQHPVNSVC